MNRWLKSHKKNESGVSLIVVLLLGAVMVTTSTTVLGVVVSEQGSTSKSIRKSSAYQAAESAVDDYIAKLTEDHLYYAHYVHPAEDTRRPTTGADVAAGAAWTSDLTWTYPNPHTNWRSLGNGYEYNLEIKAPTSQSGGVTITAYGRRTGSTKEYRAVEAIVRPASVADFQMLANNNISYGSSATTNGKIYAGIDSSGTKHSIAHSGDAYADLYAEGNITTSPTYHNGAQGYTSSNIRSVIKNPVNFANFTNSLSDIQGAAGAGGLTFNTSSVNGWKLVFQSNGTVDTYRCTKVGTSLAGSSAPTCTSKVTYNVPPNGAIYSAQDVIVQGVVKGRVTIAVSGNVIVSGNISYNQNGTDVLGLIASNEVIIAKWGPNDLTWRAASIAQNGMWRSYDSCGCKGTMTYYGSTATNDGGYMDMYDTRVYAYDPNLLFLQPPFFPILEEAYTVLSYRDITAN